MTRFLLGMQRLASSDVGLHWHSHCYKAASDLLIRTLIHLQTLPAGFNPTGVMTARLSLDDARYHDAAVFQRLLDESTSAMRQIPGVQQAAVRLSLPYERSFIMGGISISDGKETGPRATADEVYVTPDYFAALQIPVLAGRSFTEADGPDTQHVAIVRRSCASSSRAQTGRPLPE